MARVGQQKAADLLGISLAELRELLKTARYRADTIPGISICQKSGNYHFSSDFFPWATARLNRETPARKSSDTPERVSTDTAGNARTVTIDATLVNTEEDALRVAQVDMERWYVERCVINPWQGFYKDAAGEAQKVQLWQVKLFLRRRYSPTVEQAADALLERIRSFAPAYAPIAYRPPRVPHLMELAIYDHHFGKLAWARETGDNYDLVIAESLFEKAITDLLDKAAPYEIERFLLPIGNDLFHIDTDTNTTAKGTPQDTDGRLAKVVEVGQMALIRAIDRLQTVAPVTVLAVPGNHDHTTTWHTGRFLWAWYHNCPNVEVDHEPRSRKYYEYGRALIGFTHGNEEKTAGLPGLMAKEAKDAWARTDWQEWHIGHWHKAKELHWVGVDAIDGVIVRTIPSLCGKDSYHYRHGYHGTRAAEAFLWRQDEGLTGYFVTSAREEK